MNSFVLSILAYIVIKNQEQVLTRAEPMVGEGLAPLKQNEFPYVARIRIRTANEENYENCTGSLISKTHVLTAAHCFDETGKKQFVEVLIGSTDLNECQSYQAASWKTYEEWAWENGESPMPPLEGTQDIAVITLAERVNLPHMRKPIFSNKKTENLYGLHVHMVAWGSAPTHSETALYSSKAVILTKQTCLETYNIEPLAVPKDFLFVVADPYVIAKKGDSGSPLVYEGNKIVAILRGTMPSGNAPYGELNVYISIDPYKKFIHSFLNE